MSEEQYREYKKHQKCHYCKEEGHYIRDCPKKKAEKKKTKGNPSNRYHGGGGKGAVPPAQGNYGIQSLEVDH